MVTLIKDIHDQSTCNVLHKNQVSVIIPVLNGVKEDCVFSPMSFNVTLKYIMSKVSKSSAGIRWELCGKLTDLGYVDDMSVNSLHMSNANNARENRKRSHQRGLKD
jgi:hypothetical protein